MLNFARHAANSIFNAKFLSFCAAGLTFCRGFLERPGNFDVQNSGAFVFGDIVFPILVNVNTVAAASYQLGTLCAKFDAGLHRSRKIHRGSLKSNRDGYQMWRRLSAAALENAEKASEGRRRYIIAQHRVLQHSQRAAQFSKRRFVMKIYSKFNHSGRRGRHS
jgi:hypothetical protein